MSEVVYWAEKLKREWMEERTGERDGAFTLCYTEEGEESVSEEEQTGEHMQQFMIFYITVWLYDIETSVKFTR